MTDQSPLPSTTTPLDPWHVSRGGGRIQRPAFEETLFALSNGSLGVRGGMEEYPSATQGSFLSGVWERSAIDYHERFPGFARTTDTRLPVVDGTGIGLRLGEHAVDLEHGEWLHFERRLDMRHGCLKRALEWRSPQGHTLRIDSERLVSMQVPGLMCLRYTVHSVDYSGPIRLDSQLAGDHTAKEQGADPRIGVRVHGGLDIIGRGVDADRAWMLQRTRHSEVAMACAQQHRLHGEALTLADTHYSEHRAGQVFEGTLAPGQSVTLEKFVAYAWSEPGFAGDPRQLLERAGDVLDQAVPAGYASQAQAQAAHFARFWQRAELGIDGDALTEQSLRFNLFHVYQSVVRHGDGSMAAKGLTGEGYEGHYFWDAEVFALPVLALTEPQLARDTLLYRHRTLDRARAHAREMNHPTGALYAWRTISGDECSAYYPSGSAQYHINAAVAYAIRLYVDVSGDTDFMYSHGAEMLLEMARVWMQVGHFNARRGGAFCIHEVTGPDEYSALVNNNHYTNHMAQAHLRDAVAVAEAMRKKRPDDYQALRTRLALEETELAAWKAAAEAMYLEEDARLGIFPQDDSFLDKPRWPGPLGGAGKRPLLLTYHPLTLYRHQVCKQADALLALLIRGETVSLAAKRRNFDYYEGVTVHDSTLSPSTFGIMASEVGYPEKAWHYFQDTLRVDLDDRHGNADHGAHMAAMAGSWLGLAWGFGGMRIADGQLHLRPVLPKAWNGYHFGIVWHGQRLKVRVDASQVHYHTDGAQPLWLHHDGEHIEVRPGTDTMRPLPAAARRQDTDFKAVIFDLDGVLADTAPIHMQAWERLAGEIGVPFDAAVGERLKGVDRATSLDIILKRAPRAFSSDEKAELAERKNRYYVERIAQFGPQHLLPGAADALSKVRQAGLRVGLASASRNAPLLLERLGIAQQFDYVVDAGRIARSKPDPEIFLTAAAGLGVHPDACLGVEDAVAGIAAIRAAGMASLGVGKPEVLHDADAVVPDLASFDLSMLKAA